LAWWKYIGLSSLFPHEDLQDWFGADLKLLKIDNGLGERI
jgi:hypothetical protein